MSSFDTSCCSTPYVQADQRRALAISCQTRVARTGLLDLTGELAPELRADSEGLVEVLSGWAHERSEVEVDFPTGFVTQACETGTVDPVHAGACAAAELAALGVPGDWRVRLRQPARLRFGAWVTRAATEHVVSSGSDVVRVTSTVPGGSYRATLFRSDEELAGRGDLHELPTVPIAGRQARLLDAEHMDLIPVGEELAVVQEGEWTLRSMREQCAGASTLLERFAPAYSSWVTDVTSAFIPLRGSERVTRSGTHKNRFSVISASLGCRPLQLAELFVHECSHEYFRVAEVLRGVDDGTDTKEYYSPLRGINRPLKWVFLALHAVANMALFYRSCLANGYRDDGFAEHRLAELEGEAAQMMPSVLGSPALTEAGRNIANGLSEQLGLVRRFEGPIVSSLAG